MGRQTTDVSAKAPTTIPTATSPAPSGPRTYVGSTGSVAPIATKHSSAHRKRPAEAARSGCNVTGPNRRTGAGSVTGGGGTPIGRGRLWERRLRLAAQPNRQVRGGVTA